MGSDKKSKEKKHGKRRRASSSSSSSDSEDDGRRKKRKSNEDEERQRNKRDKKSSRDDNKHSKRHSDKEKKSRDKDKGKRRKRDLSPTYEFHELSKDDYFSKNNEFSTWLKDEKKVFFSDLSADSAREMFGDFVKAWNGRKLESRYYKGITSGPRSAHKWKIKT